jgi:hypothetical protein
MTDTQRSATEMLLVSQALDNAVSRIDFAPLAGQPVFLEASALDKDTVEKGYLVSLIRQQLLAAGALLQDERNRAIYVVEVRSGGIGTDRHSLLIGTPAVSLPSIVPGVPAANVPELALLKKNDQRGVAKVGVFAYNRVTGRALWQSGTVMADARSKDTWMLGAGPFTSGTIRRQPELAGEPLPTFPLSPFGKPGQETGRPPDGPQTFPDSHLPPPVQPLPFGLTGVTGVPAIADRAWLK